MTTINSVLTSKRASIHNYFDYKIKKKYYELEILTNKDLDRVIKFINDNADKYKFGGAKLKIKYDMKDDIWYATKKYNDFYKVVSFQYICQNFRKKLNKLKK